MHIYLQGSKAQKWPIGSDVLKFDAKSVRMFWATNKREPKPCSLNNKGTAVLCHEQNGAGHFLSCIIQMNNSIIKDLCSLHLNILPFSFYWSWRQLAPFIMPRWLYLLQASQCSHSNAQGPISFICLFLRAKKPFLDACQPPSFFHTPLSICITPALLKPDTSKGNGISMIGLD